MVLAAGVGSRLDPLTSVLPKPLIRIGGRSIMEHILIQLKTHGFDQIISNTHHLAEEIHQAFSPEKIAANPELNGISIEFIREEKLSGVAGGIRRCAHFLKDQTACIIMGDALTDIDLGKLYQKHKEAVKKGCIVTAAKMEIEDTRQFGVIVTDDNDRITQFQEKPSPKEALSNWANTGIYFFEPEVYEHIPSEEEADFYDVAKNLFPDLLAKGKYMQAIAVESNCYWADLGTPQQYLQGLKDMQEGKIRVKQKESIDASASIAETAKILGSSEISENVVIGENSMITNSIIYPEVTIEDGVKITDSIIGPGMQIKSATVIEEQVLAEANSPSIA